MSTRRSAVVLLATGATCLAAAALPLVPATADDGPGSGLGSYNLAANAPVVQIREDYPAQQCSAAPAGTAACEGLVNESVSTLRNGPIGHALSSVGWPGTLGGNAGSLLLVAGPTGTPDQVTALNDPVRAESFTGSKDPTATNSTLPGTLMTATATPTKVAASSTVGASQAPGLGSFGQITSSSSTTLTGASTAEAVAHSQVQDVTLGPLQLGTVVSDASATTDGTTAVPSGHTTVTRATVAGIPVTIDEHGVTVQAQNAAFPSQATDAVNSALQQAGMTVLLSTPTGKPEGASVTYTAGSVVVVWKQQGAGIATVLLGGASVSVISSQGYSVAGGPPPPPSPYTGGTNGGTNGGVAGTAVGSGLGPLSGATVGVPSSLNTGPGPAVAGATPITAVPAAARMVLPHGLSPWLGVLGLLGAGLVMAGLRRLPDHVLAAPASACPGGDLA